MGTIKRTFANSLTGTGKLSATNLDSNIPAANIADASVTNVTTLPDAVGQAIKSVAGSPPSQAVGDIWYNSVTGTLKNYVTVAAAFSSGGARNTVGNDECGSGTLTAGIAFGGGRNPNSPNSGGLPTQTITEEYDGGSWTAGGSMSTGRVTFGGGGTQTAALAFGGRITNNPFTYTNATEEYNGSAWTGGGNLGSTHYYMNRSGAGTQTAGVSVGGIIIGSPGVNNKTEEYDGSAWTTVNNMVATSLRHVFIGTQTAAILTSSIPGGSSTAVYDYDGTSWTTNAASNNGAKTGRMGFGTTSSALLLGGSPYSPTVSELWDGTSFSNDASYATERASGSSSNTSPSSSSGYMTGGGNSTTPGTALSSTEEYTGTFNATRTVTTS